MIRIAITQAAHDAIAATLPLGSVGYEAQRTEKGEVHIWLEERWLEATRPARPQRELQRRDPEIRGWGKA
jgi:hypothetical protein